MAHAILRDMIKKKGHNHKFKIESAGTHVPTSGLLPDKRTINVLEACDINSKQLRTRQLKPKDAAKFDTILVMDKSNMVAATKILGPECQHIQFLLDCMPNSQAFEVPDPYYGPQSGFHDLYNMLTDACAGVLVEVKKKAL